MEKTYAAIRDQLVMTLAAGGFGEKARVINAAVPRFHTRIITVASSSWNNPHLEITPQRPDWLAGARGFKPPSCRNCVLPTPCTRRRLPPLLGSQCNVPRAPAATPRTRAKGPAAPGGPRGGGPPTGASGKRIHGAIWHIGEAGAALPTVRLAGASGADSADQSGFAPKIDQLAPLSLPLARCRCPEIRPATPRAFIA
jgi:hypothetical protein